MHRVSIEVLYKLNHLGCAVMYLIPYPGFTPRLTPRLQCGVTSFDCDFGNHGNQISYFSSNGGRLEEGWIRHTARYATNVIDLIRRDAREVVIRY